MTKIKRFLKPAIVLIAAVDIALLIAVFFLMNYVQYLLDMDVHINLTEIVTQNKDVIASRLMLEVNQLHLTADQLSEQLSAMEEPTSDDMKQKNLRPSLESVGKQVFWADTEGNAVFANGQEANISDQPYFKLSMQGTHNISKMVHSPVTDEDVVIISMPVMVNGEVAGSIQRQYTSAEISEIYAITLFSEYSTMYIINSSGDILVSPQNQPGAAAPDNYYQLVALTNPDAAAQLEADIRESRDGFIETVIDGEKMFSAYTTIDKMHDWHLISSVATAAVSPNANFVIHLFYTILLTTVLFFAFSMFYFLRMRKKQQANLEQLAFVDNVTQGNTYTKFVYELESILPYHEDKDYWIFTFDIDNFKYINSFYGFETGDKILKHIYQIYSQKLSGSEQLARVSGDHFVMLLEDGSEQHIADFFDPELYLGGVKVHLSAGLYPISNRNQSINLMMDKAKMASQRIKGMRHKCVEVYSESFDREMIYNEQLERSVESALSRDEIVPFFQPKVDINTHELVGAEALARWHTRGGEVVPPSVFIPICEKTGMITRVDTTIFEKTLQFIRQCLDKGIPCVPISVNFSRRHLFNQDFLDVLMEKLRKYQVPPELIELELTETLILDNYQGTIQFIGDLHFHGFQISMDDFGTGYSSLHMLQDMDIDVLKIDRGFLRDTTNGDRQKAVFGAIIQMANQLKIKVVVEGVENEDNINLMREFGCSVAQGFYYAQPMEQGAFEALCETGHVD